MLSGSTDTSEVEALKAEIERLRRQLTRSKPRDFEFLGEMIPGELLADLNAGGKLSARGVQTRLDGMYGDGGNLWLQVTPGGRSWLFRFRFAGKQREMGLGSLNEIPLVDARARATICRRLVRDGVDPIERRRQVSTAARLEAQRTTFRQAAQRYLDAKKAGWRSAKHTDQFLSSLKAYAFDTIGDQPVQNIDTDMVLKVLEPIWTVKPETASRVRSRIEQVLDWAGARKMRRGENPARWRGHLQSLLPARGKVRAVEHHAALPWADMHDFWAALSERTSSSAEALRFAILTAARTGEVIGARWSEIDLAAKSWTIPAERMKAHKQHRVALSDEAVRLLERLAPLKAENDGFVFPGAKLGAPLSNMAMTMSLRKMGRDDLTVHGFRSTFRDWAAETTAYPNEMVEMALAHSIGSKVEAAYRRGDLFDKRRRLMDDWATHCLTKPAKADNLHRIGEAR
jgi:integrase